MSTINYWWVTASEPRWNWKSFFDKPHDPDNFAWSDIESPASRARIETMGKRDVVVAYQAKEGVVGFAILTSDGYQSDNKFFDSFDLDSEQFIELGIPVPYREVSELSMAKENFDFVKIGRGTVFGVTPAGFEDLIHLACRFNPKQIPMITGFANQSELEPPPETPKASDLIEPLPEKVQTTAYRILRDTELARRVKALHNYECQICGRTILLPDGKRYAEGHHIQPLGLNGPDVAGNILCLCPNHHAECDLGAIDLVLSDLRHVDGHVIDAKFIEFHNREIYKLQTVNVG